MGIRQVAAAAIVIAACVNGGVAQAKDIDPVLEQAIRQKAGEVLRDPASAILTFDIVTELGDKGEAAKICGTVNAKNGFGAYTGRKFFLSGYIRMNGGYFVPEFYVPGYSLEQAIAHGGICD